MSKTKQVAFRISSRGPMLWNAFKESIPDSGFQRTKNDLKTLLLDKDDELTLY